MTGRKFETFGQPSNPGVIAHGDNLRETFENAAFGMLSLITELTDVENKHSLEVEVKADDREELLINWLNELIFIEGTKRFLMGDFNNLQTDRPGAPGDRLGRKNKGKFPRTAPPPQSRYLRPAGIERKKSEGGFRCLIWIL